MSQPGSLRVQSSELCSKLVYIKFFLKKINPTQPKSVVGRIGSWVPTRFSNTNINQWMKWKIKMIKFKRMNVIINENIVEHQKHQEHQSKLKNK